MDVERDAHEDAVGRERRQAPRHEFGYIQPVAEYGDGQLPSAGDFQRVQIVDLSRRGFSFFTLSKPAAEQVVVVMGDPPELECLTARVVYCKLLEQYGHGFYRIGCEFTGHIAVDIASITQIHHSNADNVLQQLNDLAAMGD